MVCLSQLFREIPTQKFITKNLPTSTKHNLPLYCRAQPRVEGTNDLKQKNKK